MVNLNLQLVVIKRNGPPLLGQNWLSEILLYWQHLQGYFVKQIYTEIAHAWSLSGSLPAPLRAVPKEYDDAFQKGLGEMRKLKTKIAMKEGAILKYF